jgi:hypothetical protein
MLFENVNASLNSVATMEVGSEKLIPHVIGCEKVFQSHEGLVVQSLKFGFETL